MIHESHADALSAYDEIDREHEVGYQTYPDATGQRIDGHLPFRVSIDDLSVPAKDDGTTLYDMGGFPTRADALSHARTVIATWSRPQN